MVQEAGWGAGPGFTDTENLAHNGIRSPDRPASSKTLYRLHNPGRQRTNNISNQPTNKQKVTDLLNSENRVLEKLIVSQLVKKPPGFCGTQSLIARFLRA